VLSSVRFDCVPGTSLHHRFRWGIVRILHYALNREGAQVCAICSIHTVNVKALQMRRAQKVVCLAIHNLCANPWLSKNFSNQKWHASDHKPIA